MRVLHVTPTFYPSIGGIENVIDMLSRETIADGHIADIAHIAPALRAEAIDEFGRILFRVPLVGHSFFGIAPQLGVIARNYDLLHVHDPQLLSITASVSLMARGMPAVLSTHGGFRHTTNFSNFKWLHQKLAIRAMLNRYDLVLASSHNDHAFLNQFTNRIMLAENGVNPFRFSVSAAQQARSPWQWIYWGRITRHKRLDLVIELVQSARKMGFPVELTITGPSFDGTIDDLMGGERMSDGVRILPALTDAALEPHIANAGVFITASEYEGFGLTVLEAMAAGLPVISRDISPLNGFVSPRNGLLLNFQNDGSDLEKLRTFLIQMTENGHGFDTSARLTADRYSWANKKPIFLEAYKSVLEARRR